LIDENDINIIKKDILQNQWILVKYSSKNPLQKSSG
jgi:hypothetical protein